MAAATCGVVDSHYLREGAVPPSARGEQPAGVVVSLSGHGQELDPECIVMEFDLPDSRASPERFANALKDAMGSSHKSATFTCTSPDGAPMVYRWDAGDDQIRPIAYPQITVKLSACFISDEGNVMVALTCGEEDEVALEQMVNASVADGDAMLLHPDDDSAVEGELQRMTLADTLRMREPDLSQSAARSVMVQGKELQLRARVHGNPQMQHLMLRKCFDFSANGGCVVAVFGEQVPWEPQYEPATAGQLDVEGSGAEGAFEAALSAARTVAGTTQLQLTFESIIVDRYDLSAPDLAAMQEEILGVRCDPA